MTDDNDWPTVEMVYVSDGPCTPVGVMEYAMVQARINAQLAHPDLASENARLRAEVERLNAEAHKRDLLIEQWECESHRWGAVEPVTDPVKVGRLQLAEDERVEKELAQLRARAEAAEQERDKLNALLDKHTRHALSIADYEDHEASLEDVLAYIGEEWEAATARADAAERMLERERKAAIDTAANYQVRAEAAEQRAAELERERDPNSRETRSRGRLVSADIASTPSDSNPIGALEKFVHVDLPNMLAAIPVSAEDERVVDELVERQSKSRTGASRPIGPGVDDE